LEDFFGPGKVDGEYVLDGVFDDAAFYEKELIGVGCVAAQEAFDRSYQPKSK
jgi:hypothetical protein